jgi:hypothetical protein
VRIISKLDDGPRPEFEVAARHLRQEVLVARASLELAQQQVDLRVVEVAHADAVALSDDVELVAQDHPVGVLVGGVGAGQGAVDVGDRPGLDGARVVEVPGQMRPANASIRAPSSRLKNW